MSADVLMTGAGRDLLPTDRVTDTEVSPDLVMQQVDSILHVGEGEWVIDVFDGIDWNGFFTAKRVNLPALQEEIRRELEKIPNIKVSGITGSQLGRVVSIRVEGILSQRPFRLTVSGQESTVQERTGDGAALAPLVLQWGYNRI